jgi:hypothetical protein
MSSGRLLGGIAIGLVLVACTGGDATTTTSGIDGSDVTTSTTTTVVETTATTDLSPGDTLPREDVPPLALYLAAIDSGLMGTEYEGDVYLDPESYISVGRLFCELLNADVSPKGVLETYIASLEAESGELSDDDLVLGGVILGASVQLICPEYLDDLRALQDE